VRASGVDTHVTVSSARHPDRLVAIGTAVHDHVRPSAIVRTLT